MTTLRSNPWGRGGVGGTSPAAIHRSSPRTAQARALRPELIQRPDLSAPACSTPAPALPRVDGRIEMAKRRRQLAGTSASKLVAGQARAQFHLADPFALALHVRRDSFPVGQSRGTRLLSGSDRSEKPVPCRIVLRRGLWIRRSDRREVEHFTRRDRHLGRIRRSPRTGPDWPSAGPAPGRRPRESSVTRILANFVGSSVVSAMTHTPASGPLGPVRPAAIIRFHLDGVRHPPVPRACAPSPRRESPPAPRPPPIRRLVSYSSK